MAGRGADVFKVIMLARYAHALLSGGGPGVSALFQPQEGVLKLNHAGVGEQERGIVRNQRRAGDNGVALTLEVFEKGFSDLCTGHHLDLPRVRAAQL